MSCQHYDFYKRPGAQSKEINAAPGSGTDAVLIPFCDHKHSPFCRLQAEMGIAVSNFLSCGGAGLVSNQCQIHPDKRS